MGGKEKRINFGLDYIKEKDFASDFEAGKYVGKIINKSMVFTDKAKAYKKMLNNNKKICSEILKILAGER